MVRQSAASALRIMIISSTAPAEFADCLLSPFLCPSAQHKHNILKSFSLCPRSFCRPSMLHYLPNCFFTDSPMLNLPWSLKTQIHLETSLLWQRFPSLCLHCACVVLVQLSLNSHKLQGRVLYNLLDSFCIISDQDE